MIRKTGQRNFRGFSVGSFGQGNTENAGYHLRVIQKSLVKISHSVEENFIAVFGFYLQILLHHGSQFRKDIGFNHYHLSLEEIETGTIVGGFAHSQVLALADKVVEAVKSGAIKRFTVMAGCDGRHKTRSYYTEVAEKLPPDTVILTAGCAKYRYNKLDLGDIGGIPRVLDAGQCNDSYSLAVIALKLKEVFGLDDINELPISYDIAWYEQKAVAVLLALLHLGVKGIRLGPTLPAFVSPNVLKVLVENFDIKPIGTVEDDIAAMLVGK